jgi:hypothetical protein
MRLVGRIFLGLLIGGAAAGGAVAGCAGEPERYDAYVNENPNIVPHGGSTSTGTSTGTGTSTSTGTSTDTGTGTSTSTGNGVQTCQCAQGILNAGACATCAATAVGANGGCTALQAACDVPCNAAFAQISQCTQTADPPGCIATVLKTSAALVALIDCECSACASCQSATPVACDLGGAADAGVDGG